MVGSTRNPQHLGLFEIVPGRRGSSPSRLLPTRAETPVVSVDEGSLVQQLARISEREGEDAALTGGTRSLHRRLLALNFHDLHPAPFPSSTRLTITQETLSA